MGWIITSPITHVISHSLCMCLSVCLSTLSRSQLLADFDKIWHRRLEPDTKEQFRLGQNPIRQSPIFPSFPQGWHLHNAFSMGVLKHFSDFVSGPIIAVHNSNDVAWRPPTPEC